MSKEVLESLPDADFDDYFLEIDNMELSKAPAFNKGQYLLFEGSRGCWWGQKNHCRFCGLNAEGIQYRAKTGERVYRTISGYARKYPMCRYLATDNNLNMRYFKTLFPRLKKRPLHDELSMYFEVKVNMNRNQVKDLSVVPKPLQKPHPKIFQVGTSMKWFERAAQEGWEVCVGGPAPSVVFKEPADFYLDACRRAGTKPTLGYIKAIYLDEDENAAIRDAEESVRNFVDFNVSPMDSLARTSPEEKQRLIDAGYAPDTTPHPAKAVRMAREGDYSLIVLDVMREEMNGIEVLEQLRADERTANVPVMMITALSFQQCICGNSCSKSDSLNPVFREWLISGQVQDSPDSLDRCLFVSAGSGEQF